MAWAAIFSGANVVMFWSAGTLGEYYIRSCPDYRKNALACQAQHKATVVIPLMQELVQYNPFIVSPNKHAVPGLPAWRLWLRIDRDRATAQRREGRDASLYRQRD